MDEFHRETLTHKGHTFNVAHIYDRDHGEPWKENDGHGVITDWIDPADAPKGARALSFDNGSTHHTRFYDWAASIKLARADKWGLPDNELAALATTLGRKPTKADIAAEAVRRDYEYLRGWCADEWHYCGVVVTLDGTDIERSLWGIESNATEHLGIVARELADDLIAEAGSELDSQIERLQRLRERL